MRIRIHSDLHEEYRGKFGALPLPTVAADVTVLAGDIGNGDDIVDVAAWPAFAGSVKLLVPGNHEFYDNCMDTLLPRLRAGAGRLKDTYLLDNDVLVIGSCRFIGATLWTDYQLYGPDGEMAARDKVARVVPDYRIIERRPDQRLTVDDVIELHQASRDFIARELDRPFDGKTVVVTHHAPHPASVHPRFDGSVINPAFVSDLTDLVGRCDLWIHGHTHDSFDYRVGRARVVSNPTGYRKFVEREDGTVDIEYENATFDPAFVVTI